MAYLCNLCKKECKVVRYDEKLWKCDKCYFGNMNHYKAVFKDKEDVLKYKDNGKTNNIQSRVSK